MSRINREIFTTLDVNGPYLRIDTQPTSITSSHNGDAVFTIGVSTYYLVGDEADTAGTEDATAPTVDDNGNIIYEWYEIDANASPGTVTKLTDSTAYTGTTTNTLTVKSTQSPGSHLNQYYCIVSFDPTLVSGKYNTGDAVNESLTSDTVTLNVKPYLIINTQPVSTVTGFNPSSGTLSTKASLSDTRSPWQNYKLEYQWWEKNKENVSIVPNTRLIDGDYEVVLSTSKTVEQVVNNTQFTTFIESVSSGVSKRVGIPTEATEVTFTISGGIGGSGGDENSSNPGGIGGAGKSGEFKFSDSEINNIRNAGAPTEYILSSGSKGDDGATQISVAGGIGGLSFDQDVTLTENDSVFGGRGGSSGPGGVSGSGGGGGGGSAVISSTGEWMVIAGGGGGGAGSSPEAQGTAGQDAGDWKEFDIVNSINPNELKPATVVNFNPKAGTTQGNNIQNPIQYGFYIKSASPISSVNATTDYRVIVVWDNEVVVDTTSKLTQFGQVGLLQSLIDGKFYVTNGNVNYFVSTHKGSELGWCDDESNLSSVCVRGDGGYVNSFDVIRYSELFSSGNMTAYDGAIGASKLTGDGGGGGGAGGGAISPAAGGTAGANPVASNQVVVQFKVSGKNNTGSDYIKFVEVPWYGFPETQPNRGQTVTFTENDNIQTVTLKAGVTYDVISNFEEGDRTSDSLRILQDFTPDANQSDIIAGRSIGMNAGGVGDNIQTGNEDDFRDLIVSVSDGTFDVVPQTVRLEDGEIVGKSIIRYTAPTGFKNQTVASGGQGGQSQYNTIRLSKLSGSKNDSIGAVNMTIRTEQPFNELNQAIVDSIVRKNWSVRGAHPYTPYKDGGYTSTLEISSNYVFSKRILCQITVKDTGVSPVVNAQTSFTNSLYTDTVDFTVVDDRDNTINIERIRHNDDFAIVSSLNLDNSDITFERSGSTNTKDVEYYSFYSNRDIEVDIQMYGGKGNDQGAYVGGEGGFSYLRLNMEKDTEYVIAGLNDYVNTPFLFKKGRLLAVVGGGGDAGYNGNGAPGGGVSVNGGSAYAGGVGGSSPTILGENGVHGSATNLLPIAPDTKASIPNGGTTVRCSKGNLFQFANQPNPCADRGTNVKFATSDGTLVTNTKEINRGFKAGYNILNTAGRSNGAVVDIGWGGCGATGGQGSDTHGGGGGSGYIAPEDDLGIRVRSEGNSERVASLTTQSGLQGSGGNPISSTLGGSTGPARVVISLAEIPTDNLDEFIERPVAPTLAVSEEDVQREPEFIPLPEIVPPPPVTPPTPVLSITSAVSKGFVSGDKTYTSFSDRSAIGVLESGSIDFFVKTEDIPANTKFYWKVEKINSYGGDEFDATSGDFRTLLNSNGDVVGQFNVSPKVDNKTDWIDSIAHDWRIRIYTDANYNYEVNQNFNGRFRILDNSRTAPTAKLTSLSADTTTGVKINNEMNEHDSITIQVETLDIHNGQTIGWEIVHITTSDADFLATSGTATVSSGYQIDNDGVPSELNPNKNRGTTSFTIDTEDDTLTEGPESFALRLKYPTSSNTYFVDTKNAIGEVKKSIRINDTSQDPEADISGNDTINEGALTTYTLATENFRTGELIYWRIVDSSNNVANSDFTGGNTTNASGTATVTVTGTNSGGNRTGEASITITATADETTEGTETFTLQLYRDSSYNTVVNTTPGTNTHSTKSITVNDTSRAPEADISGNDNINEGVTTTYTISTEIFRTGELIYWRIVDSSNNIATSDFGTSASGTAAVTETGTNSFGNRTGETSITITATEDQLTEGTETFTLQLYRDSSYSIVTNTTAGTNTHSTKSITVNDTSQNPEADISGNDNINEGVATTYTLATENFRTGGTIYWRIVDSSNNVANSDFDAATGTAVVTETGTNSFGNRIGTTSIIITATEDQLTEGAETFTLQLYRDSSYNTVVNTTPGTNTHSTKSITVNDTSQDPEADISGNDTINEGALTTYTLNTENFHTGGTIYWRIVDSSNNVANSDFDAATGTAVVTETGINSAGNRIGTATIDITATEDRLTEGTETFTLQLYRDSSYSIVVNTTPGTNTHSTKSITVNDTSLGPTQYYAEIAGIDFTRRDCREGKELRFIPRAWNLTTSETGHDVYWIILDSNGEPAVQGTAEPGDFTPLDANRTIIPDFNVIKGQTTFKLKGYSKASGNAFTNPTIDVSQGYIVPVHQNIDDDQKFTAISDFFSDGAKDFKIAYFATESDRDSLSNAKFTTPAFTVKDLSRTKIAFNGETGFGVDASRSLLSPGQSLDNPSVDEGGELKRYFFRVETSAPPGTQLFYKVGNDSTNASDFGLVEINDLPDTTEGSFSYPIKPNTSITDAYSGRVTTFDRDGNSTSQKIDGVECVRSIAYIYLEIAADSTSEGEESFNLGVYLSETYDTKEPYVTQTIKINDTSENIDPPEIELSLSSPAGTFSGNADTGYSVTASDTSVTEITLKWTLSGGAATSGTFNGTGFDNNYYASSDTININDTWYTGSSEDSGSINTVERGDNDFILIYDMSVSNQTSDGTVQTVSDRVSLTVSSLEVEIIREYRRYRAVPIWRYYRPSNSGKPRWAHTTFGPGAAEAPEDPYAAPSTEYSEYWGKQLFDRIGSENGNLWYLHGAFGTVFTRQAPGTTSLLHPTRGLDGDETRDYAGLFDNYQSNAFAYLNASLGSSGIPFYGGDGFFGAIPTWGLNTYGFGDADGTDANGIPYVNDENGNPTDNPVGMGDLWTFRITDSNGNPDGVNGELYDKWVGPPRPSVSGGEWHYWDVTDGTPVYHGTSEPDGNISNG